MTAQPHGRQMNVERDFPRTRADAQRIAAVITEQAKVAGCTCANLQIEFIDPPLTQSYVQVGHNLLCPMSTER